MSSLITIDCEYVLPGFAAAYLRVVRQVGRSSAVYIETNTSHSVPRLLSELKQNGLTPEQVQYIIVTHAHLDHAGGASALMKACPNAVLLAHPKAAQHLIDPSRLIASARAVYGDEAYDQLYGTIEPISASRVRAVQDGETIWIGSPDIEGAVELRFLDTRGHAPHHLCVYDSDLNAVFTGDTFGLAYPVLQKKGLLIFPSTSPTGFEPDEAKKSIDRILATGATRVFLTHFGEVTQLVKAADQLKADLDFSSQLLEELVTSALPEPDFESHCENRLLTYFQGRLEKLGLANDSQVWEVLKLDLKLNAAGIAFAAQRKKAGPQKK